jgi:tRNA dimethylallyltransferase
VRREAQHQIVAYIGGPTACGKSAVAIELARRHGLAIISADSMQVYRGLEVGTGAVSLSERADVPHHLLSCAEPTDDFHAARFLQEACAAIDREWRENGRRSLVVGGTGLWIEALREGLFEGPGRDEALRESLCQRIDLEGVEALHAELRRVDPASAETIRPRDAVRIIRALEVLQTSGKPLSVWFAEDAARRAAEGPKPPYFVLERPREELDQRIDCRVDQMIAGGWLAEAEILRSIALPTHAPAGKALGYRELIAHLEGRLSLADAVAQIKLATRQFARAQMTWFRSPKRGAAPIEPQLLLRLDL